MRLVRRRPGYTTGQPRQTFRSVCPVRVCLWPVLTSLWAHWGGVCRVNSSSSSSPSLSLLPLGERSSSCACGSVDSVKPVKQLPQTPARHHAADFAAT
ncbi:hypothetical protein AOLI_G00019060 [Acnodon oligacanthus]